MSHHSLSISPHSPPGMQQAPGHVSLSSVMNAQSPVDTLQMGMVHALLTSSGQIFAGRGTSQVLVVTLHVPTSHTSPAQSSSLTQHPSSGTSMHMPMPAISSTIMHDMYVHGDCVAGHSDACQQQPGTRSFTHVATFCCNISLNTVTHESTVHPSKSSQETASTSMHMPSQQSRCTHMLSGCGSGQSTSVVHTCWAHPIDTSVTRNMCGWCLYNLHLQRHSNRQFRQLQTRNNGHCHTSASYSCK